MIRLPETDPISFLIAQKFPSLILALLNSVKEGAKQSAPNLTAMGGARCEREIVEYRAKLEALPAHELQSLFESETAKAEVEKAAALQLVDEARFFHQPRATADFEHWSKAAYWTLEEAIALAMGMAPEFVNSTTIRTYPKVSPFVRRYTRLMDLAKRAITCQKLFDPVLPIIFVNWAKENDIEFPAALAEKIITRSGTLIDWKDEFEKLKNQYDEHIADWPRVVEERSELLQNSLQTIELLKSKLTENQAELAAKSESVVPEKQQSPREREGMLKVIYAMAVEGYGYEPSSRRSNLVPEIIRDLELQGLSLSDDTVRRYIKEACDHLPEWKEDNR
jgi:hypothetical protein